MRRKEREIRDIIQIEKIISDSEVCRIALVDDGMPYIVALNFGYLKGDIPVLYFHCANEGRKIDIIKKNPKVCFQMESKHELIKSDSACEYSMNFKSIVGFGKICIVEKKQEKIKGLDVLMRQYSKNNYEYTKKILDNTTVLRLDIDSLSAKVKESKTKS